MLAFLRVFVFFALGLFGVFIIMPTIANAKSYLLSPLPLPTAFVLNLSTQNCDAECLKEMDEKGEIFSFVAEFNQNAQGDSALTKRFYEILKILGITPVAAPDAQNAESSDKKSDKKRIRVALILPKKIIGRYSTQSISSTLAYLTTALADSGTEFDFEVFDCVDESLENIESAYKKIKNYDFGIGIFTLVAAKNIASNLSISTPLYIPTINAAQLRADGLSIPKKLYFGGIDYESQIELALSFNKNEPLAVFNDDSAVGRNLASITKSKIDPALLADNKDFKNFYEQSISKNLAASFGQKIDKYEEILEEKFVLFNTPPISTGLIISQLSLAKKKPKALLSTQLNYNLSLLMMLKDESQRDDLLVISALNAAALSKEGKNLVEYAHLLGVDMKYEWVAYASALGVEHMVDLTLGAKRRYFTEQLRENQVKYTNRIYRASVRGFELN